MIRIALLALCLAPGAIAQTSGLAADAAHVNEIGGFSAALRAHWTGRTLQDAVEPSVTSGRILTPTIDVRRAPGVPAVQVVLNAGTVGAAYFSVGVVSPSGIRYYATSGDGRLPAYLGALKTRAVTQYVNLRLRYPFGASLAGLYTAPGTWSLYMLQLLSQDGTLITYDARQLAALFPSLDIAVTNSGTPDITPPAIGPGGLVTPIVRLHAFPYVVARVPVSDDLSGVAVVSMVAASPGTTAPAIATQAVIDYPIRQGAANTYARLASDTPAGTYTILYLYACDVATNCRYLQKPAAIQAALGTTTFQVVQ